MPVKSKKGILFIVIVLLLIDQLILYFIKYRNQSLPFSNFQFSSIGNTVNLIFSLILITGVIIHSLIKRTKDQFQVILIFTIVVTSFLVLASLTTFFYFPLTNIYIFEYPLNKVLSISLFLFYQFFLIVFMIYIWLNILTGKNSKIFISFVDSAILFIVLFLFSFLYAGLSKTRWEPVNTKKDNYNVAVVLGAAVWSDNKPSPSLTSRINKAIELYDKEYVNTIQLTGSNAPGELSEARVAFNYLLKKNFDTENVWIEENTTSTSEQVHFIKNKLVNKKNIDNIIVISDSYHLARVKEICKFFNIKVDVAASEMRTSFTNKIYNGIRESIALLVFWLFAL